MKQFVKSTAFFLAGLVLAGVILYLYSSTVFNSPAEENASLPETFLPARPGEALITAISGEVFIIRDDQIITPLPGDKVREGDIIKVVDDSICQIRFAGTASVNIRSNTLVRIQKLLSGTKDADIRTELLTGSMIYKVEELQDSENLQILAQGKIYRVEGTEFMVQSLPGMATVVSVLDGKVAVLTQNEESIGALTAREKASLIPGETDLTATAFTEEDTGLFASQSPVAIPVQDENLVFMEITTVPAGTQIYINGRLNGYSRIRGLFMPEQELSILVRKRGYQDGSTTVIPGEAENRILRIELKPLGLEDTVGEETRKASEPTVLQILEEKHRKEMAEMRTSFTQRLSAAEKQAEDLQRSENFLATENMTLEEELARSREETSKLRELIRQIQDLAGEE